MKNLLLFAFVMLGALSLSSFTFPDHSSAVEEEGLFMEIPIDLTDVDEDGWGSWKTTDCLAGLDFRVKQDGYNSYAKKYKWYVEYRNRYHEEISFNTKAVPMDQKAEIKRTQKTSDRVTASSNNGTRETWFLVAAESRIYVYVHKIKFDGTSYGYGEYENCDK